MSDDLTWHTAAKAYLARLGAGEYTAAMAVHRKAGRSPRTYRHTPSAYMVEMISYLNTNDEEAFKVRKMLEGYASAIGV